MTWLVALLGGVVCLVLGAAAFVAYSMRWADQQTCWDRYFSRPSAGRDALRERIRARGRWLLPIVRVMARFRRPKRVPSFEFRGVTGPEIACSREQIEFAASYEPDARDIFVATQMKCGTTWMQQLVYEVVCGGKGDLGDAGHVHMYATSPWIESRGSVSMEDAPRLGEEGLRIVKTHLPTRLCPYSSEARYIYVARHPVACFASIVDFTSLNLGPMAPARQDLLDWYLSDEMWWRPWPENVEGWWSWAEDRDNVLFVHYEEMIEDLKAVVERVAGFLGRPLGEAQRDEVVRKSRFDFMKANEGVFEMTPPTILFEGGSHLHTGTRARESGDGKAERERILAFCAERLEGGRYPAARFYPDLAG